MTTVYVNRYYQKDVTNNVVTKYYYLGDTLMAVKEGSTLRYQHQDHLGSSSVSTDRSGNSVGSLSHLPYGDRRNSQGTMGTDRLFTGQRLDGTGLYFYNARYYDSGLGRFVSPDPVTQPSRDIPASCVFLDVSYYNTKTLVSLGSAYRQRAPQAGEPPILMDPQFLNRYTYGRNSPLVFVDDSGNFAWAAIGAFVGGAVGFGSYAITHRDNFDWRQAALWTAGGAVAGATLGAGGQWLYGALGPANAAAAGGLGVAAGKRLAQVASTIQVTTDKLNYLLEDPGKAQGFRQLGYTMSNKEDLGRNLLTWAQNGVDLSKGICTQYGTKFEVVFEGYGPNGVYGRITAIWQIDIGSKVLRFITAIPEPFK